MSKTRITINSAGSLWQYGRERGDSLVVEIKWRREKILSNFSRLWMKWEFCGKVGKMRALEKFVRLSTHSVDCQFHRLCQFQRLVKLQQKLRVEMYNITRLHVQLFITYYYFIISGASLSDVYSEFLFRLWCIESIQSPRFTWRTTVMQSHISRLVKSAT